VTSPDRRREVDGSPPRVRNAEAVLAETIRGWPLVGRDDELRQIWDALDRDQSILIAGEAGVGKTRLARTAVERASARGWRTEWAVASNAAASIPFAALATMLPREAVGADRQSLLRAMINALELRREEGRLIVAVDDAHLLDDASAALIGMLAQSAGVRVLVTIRSREPLPDPIRSLAKDGSGIRIDLQSLSYPETARVLEEALGGQVDGITAHRLYQMAGGNMLYLRELVVGGLTSGALCNEHGLWKWRGPLEANPSLTQLVIDRLAGVDDDEQEVLETIATSGPIELDLVTAVVTVDAIRRLEDRGLVELFVQGQVVHVRMGHPLYGEVLQRNASLLRARSAQLSLAMALEARGAINDDDAVRIARWRIGAGESPSPSVLVRAANRLISLSDPVAAEELATMAAQLGGGVEAALILANALQRQGRAKEVIEILNGVDGKSDDEIVAVTTALATAYLIVGEPDRASDALAEAEEKVVGVNSQNEVRGFRGVQAMASGRLEDALDLCAPLRAPEVEDRIRIQATLASATVWSFNGQLSRAIAESEAIAEVAQSCSEAMSWAPSQLAAARLLAMLLSGQLEAMAADAHAGYDRAVEARDEEARAIYSLAVGLACLEAGQIGSANRYINESVAVNREHGSIFTRSALLYQACGLALSGNERAANESLEVADQLLVGFPVFSQSENLRARACVAALRGETTAAQKAAMSAASVAVSGGAWSLAAWALHDAARWGAASKAAPELVDVAKKVDGALVPVMTSHAQALHEHDPENLDRASRAFEEMGFILYAAEASAESAAAHARARQETRAVGADRRAHGLAERCDAAMTPALRRKRSNPLSSREEEIGALASRGLTDKEISDRLFLSVRTVHSHLRNLYSKLGISGRSELGDFFDQT
jgi:ATP/maltotriose-dependent transcriptional regulator MalT